MSVNSKMKAICDNIRLRTGGTALLSLDEIAEAILIIGGDVDIADWVHNAIGKTFPPAQLPAETAISGSDIDIMNSTSDDVYSYIDAVANNHPDYAVKETLGKDASGRFDIVRYMLANREYYAWCKKNYPKMYAWKSTSNGETVPTFTNLKDSCTWTWGKRYSHSGQGFRDYANSAVVSVPVPAGTSVTIRLKNVVMNTTYTGIYAGATDGTFTNSYTPEGWKPTYTPPTFVTDSTGAYVATITKATTDRYVAFHINNDSNKCPDAIITVNEEIAYTTVGGDTIYSTSISPRIGDTLYSTSYVGTAKGTVTAVNATNRSRTVSGGEYVRYESGDVEPTVIYTNKGDSRNGNATITQSGVTYNRYPLGDLGTDRAKLTPIFIYANEHGIERNPTPTGSYETKMCALIASRFIRDLCSGANAGNALYKYIRENCMLIIIPVANPWGFNYNLLTDSDVTGKWGGYYNYNNCNINRNYDTAGWDVTLAGGENATVMGAYAGSENETQYIMNTMVESGAVVAMSLHGLGSWEGYCAHQGQDPDGTDYNQTKLTKVVNFLKNNYGYTLRYYDSQPCQNLPSITSKSPSYITQSGAYGGIVEFSPDDVKTSGWKQEMKSNVIENAYAQALNLMAMWLSDYLENE